MPSRKKSSLSVIIPVYKRLDQAAVCLESLYLTAHAPEEIEFLAQIDPCPDFLEPAVNLRALAERNDSQLGFAANCNRAAMKATGDVLFFVNQDIYATDDLGRGWDLSILAPFEDPEVGITGARLLFPNRRVQSAGGLFDAKAQPFHRAFGLRDLGDGEVSTPCDVSWITGAALAIRAGLFSPGFDESYVGGYFEDVDLCVRVTSRGYRIRYEPRCTLIHRVGSAGGSTRIGANALLFKKKWQEHITPDVDQIIERFW